MDDPFEPIPDRLRDYLGRHDWERHLNPAQLHSLAAHRYHLENEYPGDYLTFHDNLQRRHDMSYDELEEADTPESRADIEYEIELGAYPFTLSF